MAHHTCCIKIPAWLQVDIPGDTSSPHGAFPALFAEELGLVLEVHPESEAEVRSAYEAHGLSAVAIGSTSADRGVSISVGGEATVQGKCSVLRFLHPVCPFLLEQELQERAPCLYCQAMLTHVIRGGVHD